MYIVFPTGKQPHRKAGLILVPSSTVVKHGLLEVPQVSWETHINFKWILRMEEILHPLGWLKP